MFGDAVAATALLGPVLHSAAVIPIEGTSSHLRQRTMLIPETMRNSTSGLEPAVAQPINRLLGRSLKEGGSRAVAELITQHTPGGEMNFARIGGASTSEDNTGW